MSEEYSGQDPIVLAKQAERDLSSGGAKTGHGGSDTANESGVDSTAEKKFPGAQVTYGSAASGAGDNREIPSEEGGGQQRGTGQMTKAGDFEESEPGQGLEGVARRRMEEAGGEDDVRANIRN